MINGHWVGQTLGWMDIRLGGHWFGWTFGQIDIGLDGHWVRWTLGRMDIGPSGSVSQTIQSVRLVNQPVNQSVRPLKKFQRVN